MPSAKKVAWAQLRVGLVAAAAFVIMAILVFLITGEGKLFASQSVLYTYLEDSAAMTPGAEIRLNGIEIGAIKQIDLTGQADRQRTVRVAMEIYSSMLPMIPVDSEVKISAPNVLGSKYLNIKRGRSPTAVQAGAELKSQDVSDFEELVESGYSLLTSLRGMLARIDKIVGDVERGSGSIGKLLYDTQLYDNLNSTAAEARKIVAQINTGKGTVSRLLYDETLLEDIRGTIARVNTVIEGLQQGQGTAGRLLKDPSLYEDLRKTVAEFRQIAVDLNAGKGTAGKFLKDEAMHKQVQGLIAELDTLIEKINRGEGTLGQLVVNPQMYESLNGATREFQSFMKDFRANPKKFLSIKLGLF